MIVMNKIVVDNEIINQVNNYYISKDKMIINNDGENYLELNVIKNVNKIIVSENVNSHILLFGDSLTKDLEILLEKNSKLTVSTFLFNGSGNVNIYLKGENASIVFNLSNLCTTNSDFKFFVYHQASKTNSNLIIHGLSINKSDIYFDVNGFVDKNSSGCSCMQDSKIIHLDKSNSKINPNLYIDNYDIEASHSAYIGSFSEKEIFYLMSRGISRKDAYQLLTYSFLFGKMKLDEEVKNKWIKKVDVNI